MNDLRPVSLTLAPSMLSALDERAKREDRSRSAVVRRIVEAALEADARARAEEVRRWRESGDTTRRAA